MNAIARSLFLSVLLAANGWAASTGDAHAAANRAFDVTWAVQVAESYRTPLAADITYFTANNFAANLDVYAPVGQGRPRPTLLYIHGGGWMEGITKNSVPLAFLPFLQLGWVVVNIDYRPSSVSLAPAAVEDCLCALRWVGRNAGQYNIDTKQVVIMGHSAGGHLALTTGMIPLSNAGLGGPCAVTDMHAQPNAPAPVTPAAIVNWFGITDVLDLVAGPHQQGYAVRWLGNQPDRVALARSVSPLSYVRAGLPPIVTIHGERDPLVPVDHARRLHAALEAAAVPNKLIVIPQAGHGRFGVEATRDAYVQVLEFLDKASIRVRPE